ncbi:MAG TPA: sigma-70 family RNA polymerase sigma factor [Polyangiales bacterium]
MSLDARELELLYRRHGPTVFRRAQRLLRNDAEAHELVQDLFLSLLDRPAQLTERSSMTSWFYAATTHACLNRLRNQRNRARILAQRGSEPSTAHELSPDDAALLHDALARLPANLAEVAVYAFFDELSQEEIAPLIGCSRRQVGILIERVRAWGREQESSCSSA